MKLLEALTILPPELGSFPRSFNAIENLEFFLAHGKKSENLLRKVADFDNEESAEEYSCYSNETHNYLKACYLFAEVFFGAFVSDLSERETTFQSFLTKPKVKPEVILPPIEKLTQALAISAYRGKIIGHIKTPGAYNAITSRTDGYRIIYHVLSSEGALTLGFPREYFQVIDEYMEKFCPDSIEKNYWNRLDLLFNLIPFGKYGQKSNERIIIDDIIGKIGTRSKTLTEIEKNVIDFITSFNIENNQIPREQAYRKFRLNNALWRIKRNQ